MQNALVCTQHAHQYRRQAYNGTYIHVRARFVAQGPRLRRESSAGTCGSEWLLATRRTQHLNAHAARTAKTHTTHHLLTYIHVLPTLHTCPARSCSNLPCAHLRKLSSTFCKRHMHYLPVPTRSAHPLPRPNSIKTQLTPPCVPNTHLCARVATSRAGGGAASQPPACTGSTP